MAQQPKLLRVKALKMFQAPVEGVGLKMLNPGDIVDVDLFLGSMLINSLKAELTEEKPHIQKDYQPPARAASIVADPMAVVLHAIEGLTKVLGNQKTAAASR
jgi:hypothetical protein